MPTNYRLQALARQLEEQYQNQVQVEPLDLSAPEAKQRLATALEARRRVPDVLVNCGLSAGAAAGHLCRQ